jgi:hypothetical protein
VLTMSSASRTGFTSSSAAVGLTSGREEEEGRDSSAAVGLMSSSLGMADGEMPRISASAAGEDDARRLD